MSIQELKLHIINKIATIEDELILEKILRLVEIELGRNSVYRLTDDERKAINEGFNDVQEGRVYSSEAARNVIIGLRKILSEDKNLLRRLAE